MLRHQQGFQEGQGFCISRLIDPSFMPINARHDSMTLFKALPEGVLNKDALDVQVVLWPAQLMLVCLACWL